MPNETCHNTRFQFLQTTCLAYTSLFNILVLFLCYSSWQLLSDLRPQIQVLLLLSIQVCFDGLSFQVFLTKCDLNYLNEHVLHNL